MSTGLPGNGRSFERFSSNICFPCKGWTQAERDNLGQELSDVLIYLVRLAEQCHVDLPAAVLNKFKLNASKYPIDQGGSRVKYSSHEQ